MTVCRRLLLLALCLITVFSSVSCADFGEGDSETAFYDYFSKVYLITHTGIEKKKIKTFNEVITMEDSDNIKTVVPAKGYCYLAFKVAKGYTLTVEEFAFFAKGDKEGEKIILDFFISDTIPTKVKDLSDDDEYTYLPDVSDEIEDAEDSEETEGEEVYTPETNEDGETVERENEVGEDIFSLDGYARTVFELGTEWDSIHLEFEEAQTVNAGQYIVIRVRNNCNLNIDLSTLPPNYTIDDLWMLTPKTVDFTFNYLMFRFTSVSKEE